MKGYIFSIHLPPNLEEKICRKGKEKREKIKGDIERNRGRIKKTQKIIFPQSVRYLGKNLILERGGGGRI